MMKSFCLALFITIFFCSCGKDKNKLSPQPPPPASFSFNTLKVNGRFNGFTYYGISTSSVFTFSFSAPLNRSSASNSVVLKDRSGTNVAYSTVYANGDSNMVIQPSTPLHYLNGYELTVTGALTSAAGSKLLSPVTVSFTTPIDSTDKFPRITGEALLDTVQRRTFRYFWDFAHPVSGLSRERSNGDNTIVTTGGSGFGVMALIAGINRGFITRAEGLGRMQTVVEFLKNTAQIFHGAFPHWIDGTTGKAIPFSAKDDGADIVETAFLVQGLLAARQYFNGSDNAEKTIRDDINAIWNRVEWSWFRKNSEEVLYWHWSNQYNWEMNMQVKGWNECLVTYVLAASSITYPIEKAVYDNGWASNGAMANNKLWYGYRLPLGPDMGGPLFFSHYSFLGINPKGLLDAYANYETQTRNHALINYSYCKANPRNYFGYSEDVWGLTASDIPNGYSASSPANDLGVIAPTAAIASIPYTPAESVKALEFFYYTLGDKLWKDYGFVDAFSLQDLWFADSFLAIDQGPIIIMIENYRSGLLWNLFMSCPEIKTGMQKLRFNGQ